MKWLVAVLALLSVSPAISQSNSYQGVIRHVKDADTFVAMIHIIGAFYIEDDVRLFCVNAPEKWTDAGKEMKQAVIDMDLGPATFVLIKEDSFGRWIAFVTPEGWDETLQQRLYRMGAPLWHGLNKTERAICEDHMKGITP